MAKTEQRSAPAGTGHTPGLGEAFSINLSTGQGTFSYGIPLPEGVAGHSPQLALEYVHGAGHGPWGLGWRLPLRSINRRLDFGGPDDGLTERFLDGDNEIVPLPDGSFGAMRESTFSRYTRIGDGWRIEERNGHVHQLGTNAGTRLADPDHPGRVVAWLLGRTTDTSGNAIEYTYRLDQGLAYLATIRYAIYELRLTYEARPDVRFDGRAGYPRRRALRCARMQLVRDPGVGERVLRTYEFAYESAPGSGVSLLSEIRLTVNGAAGDGSDDVRRPAIRLRYSRFEPGRFHPRLMESEEAPPPGLDDKDTALVTLDNAPLPGILVHRAGRAYYWANRDGRRWSTATPLRRAPAVSSFRRSGLAFVDMDGSGTADLMVADPDSLQGYYPNDGRVGWKDLVPFPRGQRATPAWTDRRLRLADVDNDGLVDALASHNRAFVWWRNRGRQGWSDPTLVPKTRDDLADVDLADPDVHLADMTGDGGRDLVRVRSGRVEYWPSLGYGRFGERVVMEHSPRLRRDVSRDGLLLVDVDGDGCADLVHVSAEGISIYQNMNGAGFAEPVTVGSIPAPLPGTVRAVNLSGHAQAGLIWNTVQHGRSAYVQLALEDSQQPPYLLTQTENGSGLRSEIFYRSAIEDFERDRLAGERWTTNFPFPYLVVGRTLETDSVSGRRTEIEFRYHEAHFETGSRQFQGFRRTERLERGDASRPDVNYFHHFLMAQERQPGNGPEHAALNGLLSRVETLQLDGSPQELVPMRIETSEYDLVLLDQTPDGRSRSFVSVRVHRQEDTDRTGDSRIEEKTYTYDAFGNVTRELCRGSGTKTGVVQPSRMRTTGITYAVSATRYLADKVASLVTRDEAGQLLTEKRHYYDGPDFIGMPLGEADRGLVTREEEWTLTQADFDAHYAGMDQNALGYVSAPNADGVASVFATPQRHRYDARGIRVATRDALAAESRLTFDPSGLFRTRLSDPIGDTDFEYDDATGQIVRVTYADGGVTRFSYDAQGRLLRSALPGEDLATAAIVHSYDETVIPHSRTTRFRQPGGVTSTGVTYFDGAGKEFQQRVEIAPGQFVVSGLKPPNPFGDLREEFEPVFAADAEFALPDVTGLPSRRIFYDVHGRTVRSVNFNGGVSAAEYRPFDVTLYDANDNDDSPQNRARGQFDTPRVEEFDVFRYLVRVTERVGPGQATVTSYDVGPLGELNAVSDRHGVKFRYRTDRRGNRLSIDLRESGERHLWYDSRDKLVRNVDPAGTELTATWDDLGRQLSLSSGGNVLEQYRYDDVTQNALGRLAEVNYVGGRQTFTYDPAGRLVRKDHFHDGVAAPHGMQFEYDSLGRETAVIHPDGTRIDRNLMFNGWLRSVPSVIQQVDYDARGLPLEVLYQNGVRTSYSHTPGPGRVTRQVTVSPLNEVLEDTTFTLDAMNMVLSRNDVSPSGTGLREFAYDPLYQLTTYSSVENGNPVVRNYEYSADYNLRRFDEAQATLHYDDPAHSDRLSGMTPDGGALFATNYDGNGNLLNLPGQQFEYDAKNELSRFTRSDGLVAEYRYDHLGARVSKTLTDASGQVRRHLYIGERAEIRNGVPVYFVSLAALRIAVVTGGVVRFLHGDGLGSTSFVTDATGQPMGRVDHHPFGNEATSEGDIDFRTFSLHPVDEESGLVYMRRRYYSPQLGRLLTPDLMAIYQPEAFLHTPQGLHLYAFVANDPLNKTDPTGLSFWSVFGAVVGVVVGIVAAVAIVATGGALGVLLAVGLALGASLLVTGVSYIIASNVDPNSAFGQFMRGFMIGFNAGMNGVLASAIFGPTVGIALGVINFLAAFDGIAENSVYQGILGWSSWLMPMSWGATGLGLVFYAFNLIVAGITFQQWDAAKIDRLAIDWKTGTIVMVGGLIKNGTAYNLGNFVVMNQTWLDNPASGGYDAVLNHETGHTLNVAAFGTAFAICDMFGAIGSGVNDYGERIAESHTNRGRPTIPMWG